MAKSGVRLPDLFDQGETYLIWSSLSWRCQTVETMGRKQSGGVFPVQAVIAEAAKGDGSLYIGTFRDITDLRDRERSPKQSEKRYRELFENYTLTDQVKSETFKLHSRKVLKIQVK